MLGQDRHIGRLPRWAESASQDTGRHLITGPEEAFRRRCYKKNASGIVSPALTASDAPAPFVTAADVRSVFPREAIGLDGVPGHALRSCMDQLAEVFTDIFNLSFLQAEVLTCFKKTVIIPVPKKAHATKKGGGYTPIYINRAEVERAKSIKFQRMNGNGQLEYCELKVNMEALEAYLVTRQSPVLMVSN
eukprot:g41591.t1